MHHQWRYIGIFLIIALAIPAVAILLAGLLSPRKPNPIKNSIYECGIETVGETWVQFKVQYYIYGLVFLVFDVEAVLLYPGRWRITRFRSMESLKGAFRSHPGQRFDLRVAKRRLGVGVMNWGDSR